MIVFNKPYLTGNEFEYMRQAHEKGKLSGDGQFSKRCQELLTAQVCCQKSLLTSSCTQALEMSAILLDMQSGDEVIMPSFTFVSTANAFVLRGAIPVFVDIRPDTLNIDETKIEAAITSKTKAIVPMHYAGVACEMDKIMALANKYNLAVVEDAAQGVGAYYKGRALGGIGHLGAFSFHDTKNIISGEGGALLINDAKFIERAEIVREKGTDRSKFLRGQIDKYTWVDIGSSFLPSEITAAFLLAQLEKTTEINRARMIVWDRYHQALESCEKQGLLRRPIIPAECQHNAHMYYILLPTESICTTLIKKLHEKKVSAVSHYVPLHSCLAGKKYARVCGEMKNTDALSSSLLRLPLWVGIDEHINYITETLVECL